MASVPYVVDPTDPRAPSQEVWDGLTEAERLLVVQSLPSDIPRATPPEGDAHRIPKSRALEAALGNDGRVGLDGTAALLDARELIDRLSGMVNDAVRRAEEEARRADRLAAKLRELGVDPDSVE